MIGRKDETSSKWFFCPFVNVGTVQLVLNNFGGDAKHTKLMVSMFQNMFPAINVQTVGFSFGIRHSLDTRPTLNPRSNPTHR